MLLKTKFSEMINVSHITGILPVQTFRNGQILTLLNHMRFNKTHPVFAALAATKIPVPSNMVVPPNSCIAKKLPPSASINAPAIGAPVKVQNAKIGRIIPILVPIFDKSVVKLDSADRNKP